MKFIHIFRDGKMDEITYNEKKINEKKLLNYFNKISKSQGSCSIKKLYSWDYNNYKIICYGWYDGENGFENNHGLPNFGTSEFIEEDSSLKKLYGDIFIIKINNNKYFDITVSEYSVFYSSQIEDYSDYESDINSENEYSDDETYDNLNNQSNKDYDINIQNNNFVDYFELEYDNNEY